MKRIALFVLILISTIVGSQAQSPVFYGGLKLGMTPNEVRTILSNNSIHYETDTYDGESRYIVNNPVIGGVKFQKLVLRFKRNKLNVANFVSNESAGGNPAAPSFSQVSTAARHYRSCFNDLYASLQSKYGQPTSSDDYEYRRSVSGSIIKLKYSYMDEMDGAYMRQAFSQIYLMYERRDTSDL